MSEKVFCQAREVGNGITFSILVIGVRIRGGGPGGKSGGAESDVQMIL